MSEKNGFDEEKFADAIIVALDRLENAGIEINKAIVHLDNMQSEIITRRLRQAGKLIERDDFGGT